MAVNNIIILSNITSLHLYTVHVCTIKKLLMGFYHGKQAMSRDINVISIPGIKLPSNSFLSPQWGGIYIYNIAPPTVNDTLPLRPVLNMKHVMSVFITQLRLLLNMQLQVTLFIPLHRKLGVGAYSVLVN